MTALTKPKAALWRQWLDHPEKFWLRQALFQIHFWVGAITSAYVFVMGVSGSVLVYRNELSSKVSVKWLVDLHENLLAGSTGHVTNGIGGICLVLLCLTGAVIWWPGRKYWRRSLTVDWRAHFPRINWDLHSALGFWFFAFVVVWGLSGIYFAFPRAFGVLLRLDPADRFTDEGLSWLSRLHFGRFGWFAEAVWALAGLGLAILAFTGMFICCRRAIYGKPSNPKS